VAAAPTAPVAPRIPAPALAGLAALLLITLADNGATRMYASPWSLARWAALIAPVAALALRGASRAEALRLPPAGWLGSWSLVVGGVLASAWLSPWRGPSLIGAFTPLAAAASFFLVYDCVQAGGAETRARLERCAGWLAAIIAGTSLFLWVRLVAALPRGPDFLRTAANLRNPFPLGHSNYTAGLAVLLLSWPVRLARQARGPARAAWALVAALDLAVLFTSGSRGGLLGLAGLVAAGLWLARPGWKQLAGMGFLGLVIVALLAILNPRIREISMPRDPQAPPDESSVQRSAMLRAGWSMGLDRPFLGWGPNATPHAYPAYRGHLDGGVEDALELHNSPVQLWAETGAIGSLGALALCVLAAAGASRNQTAAAALAGYAVYSLTDWQLDVPIFAFLAAAGLALLAPPARGPASPAAGKAMTAATLACLGLAALGARPDPAPELNVRALAIGKDPARAAEAIALLNKSLEADPDQEIAHFNLGWLLVTRDPAAAERNFAAAALIVPDKGGVYFGLGLARLNQARANRAADALALECLNDPLFIASPWWRVPELARIRAPMLARLARMQAEVIARLPADRWPGGEARYMAALTGWFAGNAPASSVAAVARTWERRDYFLANAKPPDPAGARLRSYRRERSAYPVLMRDLDLDRPIDLYDVQEDSRFTEDLAFLFPAKGWLPAPLMVSLLQADLALR